MLKEEKLFFNSGVMLCGIFTYPEEDTDKCVVLCHGLTVDKEEDGIYTALARKLAERGFAVFRFDFRGHGESSGKQEEMTVEGEEKDVESAYKLVKSKGYRRIGIVAASFAGGCCSFFAARHPEIKALVMLNALIDYDSQMHPEKYPGLKWAQKYCGKPAYERAMKHGYTTIGADFRLGKKCIAEVFSLKPWEELIKVKAPVLFIHGDKDTYVPCAHSTKYSKLMKNSRLVIIEGAEHGFHDNPEDAEKADDAVIQFMEEHL